jgi:hypothetical protein
MLALNLQISNRSYDINTSSFDVEVQYGQPPFRFSSLIAEI